MELANVPAQLVEAWANGDSTKTNPIPVPSQQGVTPGAASWTDGFPPLCAEPLTSGGIPPSKADMNGGLYQMSAIDVWMSAGGSFPYSSAFSTAIGGYPKGARVLMASGAGYWVSTVDNNTSDPDTGGAGWASADENAITALTGDVTATGPGSAAATLAASGVTAGSYAAANITVDAKGRVTVATGNAIPHDVTGSRVLGTTYQNTGTTPITVNCVMGITSGTYGQGFGYQALVGPSSTPTINVSQGGKGNSPGYSTASFIVPAGYYYSVTQDDTNVDNPQTPSLISWVEYF